MITSNNFDRELSNNTKILIKAVCYIISLCFVFYAIIFNSGIAAVIFVFAGLPLSAMAISIKTSKTQLNNNTIILNSPLRKSISSKGIFSPFTLYAIGIILIIVSFVGSFSSFKTPLMMSGIATVLFNLARKRNN